MANKAIQLTLAGAALALFSGEPATVTAAPPGARIVTVDGDENFVNDNGHTAGDIFQQNAQDQSTVQGRG
ncbi:MAG: hypothetical protein VYA67_22760 [Actinomycetota bacterium]|uniref:Uncharacterized protein n=1 Tax=Mycobacterium lentiflavum TaxID=141349 RepID=A0ABY3UVK4_MYCLN|nr:hypothetical protein [Mycobacterium lentiflavum]MEE3066722.1 hypothetical protein [Actinomycetota bacterium]ULP41729.1 hypothetical protein MJO58_23320 [Mycobacterium lentiflavum]